MTRPEHSPPRSKKESSDEADPSPATQDAGDFLNDESDLVDAPEPQAPAEAVGQPTAAAARAEARAAARAARDAARAEAAESRRQAKAARRADKQRARAARTAGPMAVSAPVDEPEAAPESDVAEAAATEPQTDGATSVHEERRALTAFAAAVAQRRPTEPTEPELEVEPAAEIEPAEPEPAAEPQPEVDPAAEAVAAAVAQARAEAEAEEAEADRARRQAEQDEIRRAEAEAEAESRAAAEAEQAERARQRAERDEARRAEAEAKRERRQAKKQEARDAKAADKARKKDEARAAAAVPAPPDEVGAGKGSIVVLVAGIVGAIGLVFSLALALGALLVAVGMDDGTTGFSTLSSLCDALVGPMGDLVDFTGENAAKKQSLVAWGLGSMVYLVVGLTAQSLRGRVDEHTS